MRTPPAPENMQANARTKNAQGGGPGTVRSKPDACGGLADDQVLSLIPPRADGPSILRFRWHYAARKEYQSCRTLTDCRLGSACPMGHPALAKSPPTSPNPPPPDDPGKAHAFVPHRADLVRRLGVYNLFGCHCQSWAISVFLHRPTGAWPRSTGWSDSREYRPPMPLGPVRAPNATPETRRNRPVSWLRRY